MVSIVYSQILCMKILYVIVISRQGKSVFKIARESNARKVKGFNWLTVTWLSKFFGLIAQFKRVE